MASDEQDIILQSKQHQASSKHSARDVSRRAQRRVGRCGRRWRRLSQLRERRVRNKSRDARVEKSTLIGRLVDENGDRITPSHARQRERKYRYYVTRNVPAQVSAPSRVGWRLPARELEERVATAVREMLDDEASVLRPLRKLTSTLAKSTRYSRQHAPGVTVFNQKLNKRPRLPRSWSGWNSDVTACAYQFV